MGRLSKQRQAHPPSDGVPLFNPSLLVQAALKPPASTSQCLQLMFKLPDQRFASNHFVVRHTDRQAHKNSITGISYYCLSV